MKQDKNEKVKKKYTKPFLRRIELATDEVLATGCKTSGGRAWPGLPDCGLVNSCVSSGS